MLMNEKERADRAFALNTKIIENEQRRRALLIENIGLLSEVFEGEFYKEILGDPEGTFAGFLGQVEVYYTRAEVMRYIKIRQKLVGEFGFDLKTLLDIPVTRLENVASYCESKESAEKMLDVAKVALSSDWRDEVNELRGKHTSTDHEHDFSKVVKICSICGRKQNVEHTH
jgi:hypothetical protein